MADDYALTKNAADRQQVKRAGRKVRRREADRFKRLRAVLSSYEGRAWYWDLLARAGAYRSVFSTDQNVICYNSGRQDFGHEMIADALRADEKAYDLMAREARLRDRSDRAEAEAGQIDSSDSGEHET